MFSLFLFFLIPIKLAYLSVLEFKKKKERNTLKCKKAFHPFHRCSAINGRLHIQCHVLLSVGTFEQPEDVPEYLLEHF